MATIIQRGPNTFRITVSNGRLVNGKQDRKTITVHIDESLTERQRQKEVERLAYEFERKVKNGKQLDGAQITLAEFAERWLKVNEEAETFAPKTILSYNDLLSRKILPFIGHKKMDKILPTTIIELLTQLKKAGMREDYRFVLKADYIEKVRKFGIAAFARELKLNEKTISNLVNGGKTTPQIAETITKYFEVKPTIIFDKVHKKDGKLSGNSLSHVHACLSSLFSDAVAWQVIAENPCDRVEAPKIKRKEAPVYDAETFDKVFDYLETEDDIRLKAIVYITIFTGCRLGELSGLRWDDIDFENNRITIQRAAQYVNNKKIEKNKRTFEKEPKNETSVRTIAVPGILIEVLKKYKIYQLEQKLILGKDWQAREKEIHGQNYDNDRVIKAWDGCAVHPDSPSKMFKAFREKYNLPPLTFHQLRHSNASLLIAQGVDVATLSRRLGHSNPGTTTKIYSHALKRPDRDASDKLEALFVKKTNKNITGQA
jgi:integrase